MTEIEWKNPPASRSGPNGFDWRGVADALRARPGEWALVRKDTSSTHATYIKQARIVAFAPAGSFDARSVQVGDGKADIYARFIGEVVTR